ncbi:probable arginine--tRNA ligase, mitochondrial [Zerene cesonia]|uniref:probable arginine--tRNA ligase, mitochondrial n=1 Tax=Zerene cesonia TaxID=33412 RepID=UPI0018E50753|nr:probable arginine--tRNA ligase, mitochondrial [Zerene cesonia]
MSTRLMSMLADQLVSHQLINSNTLNKLTHFRLTYKHTENIYVVNLSSNESTQISEQARQKKDSESLLFEVDRNLVIKNVLDGIKQKENVIPENPKKIVIDYSSPNIAKPFHVGHLRSTIIGNFIANINTHFNNKVTKINYLGDWGTQFGLLQYGLKAKNVTVDELKKNSFSTLYNIYVETNKLAATDENIQNEAKKYFSDIEQGNADLETWRYIRDITVKELQNVYKRLGITFDHYEWESDYNGGAIKDLMQLLEKRNIITTHASGKKVATVNDRDVTVLKSDNSTLYISRDIAALLSRYKRYNFDEMLYVVDNAQTDHFNALIEIVKKLNSKCAMGCRHIKFGRIQGMSTRKGNVIFLNDILDEAKAKMHEKQLQSKNTRSSAMNEETCDILGTTAVIINDLKQKRQKDYVFDWDRALQSEGDSGVKLQYLHCRLWSLEKNSGVSLPDFCYPEYLEEEIIGEVVAELACFDNILHKAYLENEACIIVNYLFRLSRYVNRMFNEVRVKGVSNDIASQRLLVFFAVRQVVNTALKILGVKPLNEM